MARLQAVIFDLDDTLFPEIEFVKSGFRSVGNWAASRYGLVSEDVVGELTALHRESSTMVFNRWLVNRKLDLETVAEMLRVYRDHQPTIRPFPEVSDLLTDLKRKYVLGLISDGFLNVQRNKWKALDLSEFFKAVVFSDQLGRAHWKPDPAPYRLVLEQLKIEPSKAVYIGDNPSKDFLGARRVGMSSIRFRHSEGVYRDNEPVDEQAQPDFEFTEFDELRTHLLG